MDGGLSLRQVQKPELLAGPYSMVVGARKLDISSGTLRTHIRDMKDRLELGAIDSLRQFARQEIGRAD